MEAEADTAIENEEIFEGTIRNVPGDSRYSLREKVAAPKRFGLFSIFSIIFLFFFFLCIGAQEVIVLPHHGAIAEKWGQVAVERTSVHF